jgi:murein DD-endopeptidase MepM/ murein hydrolase activator NlpD
MAVFPVPQWTEASYHIAPRSFGSIREHGKRLHAGCDLYAPLDSPILAVSDGVVIQGPYDFYSGTDALEVQHDGFIIRYGEINKKHVNGIHPKLKVKAGQLIGYVGNLKIKVHPMLHFEMYSGKGHGPLTVRGKAGGKYQRRNDLMDPTSFLDSIAPHHAPKKI